MDRTVFGASIFRLLSRRIRRMRAAAIIAASLLAAPGAAAWEGANIDLPGSDYAAFCTATAANCRELCLAQPQCRAFTWIQVGNLLSTGVPAWLKNCYPGGSNYAAACFLKSAIPAPVQKFAWPYTYYSGIKETRTRQRTTPRGCQWGNSITRPGQRACFCWEGSYQVERPIHVCQGN